MAGVKNELKINMGNDPEKLFITLFIILNLGNRLYSFDRLAILFHSINLNSPFFFFRNLPRNIDAPASSPSTDPITNPAGPGNTGPMASFPAELVRLCPTFAAVIILYSLNRFE